jgi:hypothetical protein
MSAILSRIVVISWWSNCLGLTCLHHLAAHTRLRAISVVQVGKSAKQRERFREHLPAGITELPYPEEAPAEHARVLADVSLRQLRSERGVWFVDHDVFLHADWEAWLLAADEGFSASEACLCLPRLPVHVPAITQPAFWLSPARWPASITSFDPIPFEARAESRRPDLFHHSGDLRMPVKDTLVQARDELAAWGRTGDFPLDAEGAAGLARPSFPAHTHLGGLHLFTGPKLPAAFDAWVQATVTRFTDFYAHCPAEWLVVEDPELLRRLRQFQGLVYA